MIKFILKVLTWAINLPAKLFVILLEARYDTKIPFITQGYGFVWIAGHGQFFMGEGSCLKSATYIECSGNVRIGRHFHCGRGLTIFSTDHDYYSPESLPYSSSSIARPVIIGDYVWIGANVTILPGAIINDGVVVGAGSVDSGELMRCGVYAGNPAKLIKKRDIFRFDELKADDRA